jgi:endonuclease-8
LPEGHTIHRLARDHQKQFGGAPVHVTSPQGRFSTGAELVDGMTLRGAEAYGKHLLHRYGPDTVVHVHLGLYGKFTSHTGEVAEPRGQVRMRMVGTDHWADLRGATACEVWTAHEVDTLLDRLGPDPLRKDADPERAWARISRSKVTVGALLMDQKVLAGVGNVYRAEVLFRHGIGPHRSGRDLDRAEWDAVWLDLVGLMKVGVRRGRIVTIRPEDDHGDLPVRRGRVGGPRSYVYRRAGLPCRTCGTPVLTEEMVGRNLFWCPTCQPD